MSVWDIVNQIESGKRAVQMHGRRGVDCYMCGGEVFEFIDRDFSADGHVAHKKCADAIHSDLINATQRLAAEFER